MKNLLPLFLVLLIIIISIAVSFSATASYLLLAHINNNGHYCLLDLALFIEMVFY